MKVQIEVPDYSIGDGVQMLWDPNFRIEAKSENGLIMLHGNKAGLLSLARLLLTLADERVPSGYHWHLTSSDALAEDSDELIVGLLD